MFGSQTKHLTSRNKLTLQPAIGVRRMLFGIQLALGKLGHKVMSRPRHGSLTSLIPARTHVNTL